MVLIRGDCGINQSLFILQVEGNCTFNRVRKESKPLGHQNDELSRSSSLTSVTSLSNRNPDQGMTIIDGSAQIENMIEAKVRFS